jgi:hypothetical protein
VPRLSTLPPSNPRACPLSPHSLFGRRSTPSHLPPRPLPVDSPLLRLLSSCSFPVTRNHTCNSPQEKQQSHPVGPWSAHIPPSGQWPSPFPRFSHAISTTATAAGELFLFGGKSDGHSRGDLHVISTRDFSTTLLKTSGDVPSARFAPCAIFTSTILLIWGGSENVQHRDDSFYQLNLDPSDIFYVKTCSADQSFLRSSIARVDPYRGQWSRARRSFLPYHDNGQFQALPLRWPDQRNTF